MCKIMIYNYTKTNNKVINYFITFYNNYKILSNIEITHNMINIYIYIYIYKRLIINISIVIIHLSMN